MSKLVKDIVDVCLKEDLQKVLQKTTELKEARLSGNDLQSRISSIAKMNKLADPNKIYAGKTLNIDGSKYTIKRGDNLTKIARSFPGAGKTPAPRSAAPKPVAAKPAAPAPKPVAAKPAAPAPKPVAAPRPQTTSPVADKTSASPQAATKPSDQYNRPITGSEPRLPAGRFQSPAVSKATPAAAPTMSMPPEKAPATLGANRPDWPGITPNKPQTATTKAPAGPPMPTGPGKFISPIDSGIPGLPKITKRSDTTPPPIATQAPEAPKIDGAGPRKLGIPIPTNSVKPNEPGYEDLMTHANKLRTQVGSRYVPPNINQPKAPEPPAPKAPEPPAPKPPESEKKAPAPAAGSMMVPTSQTGGSVTTNPANDEPPETTPAPKANNVNESVVTVGSYKYRVI